MTLMEGGREMWVPKRKTKTKRRAGAFEMWTRVFRGTGQRWHGDVETLWAVVVSGHRLGLGAWWW